MSNILSIDWDYVTGSCDNGGCCGFCTKSRNFLNRGSGHKREPNWRNRFNRLMSLDVSKTSDIYVAECHASIMEVLTAVDTVFDFDFHYDSYNSGPFLKCENWIYYFIKMGGKVISQRQHFLIDILNEVNIDKVFICNSSPWTPVAMDVKLFELINTYSKQVNFEPKFIGHAREILKVRYTNFLHSENKWKKTKSL